MQPSLSARPRGVPLVLEARCSRGRTNKPFPKQLSSSTLLSGWWWWFINIPFQTAIFFYHYYYHHHHLIRALKPPPRRGPLLCWRWLAIHGSEGGQQPTLAKARPFPNFGRVFPPIMGELWLTHEKEGNKKAWPESLLWFLSSSAVFGIADGVPRARENEDTTFFFSYCFVTLHHGQVHGSPPRSCPVLVLPGVAVRQLCFVLFFSCIFHLPSSRPPQALLFTCATKPSLYLTTLFFLLFYSPERHSIDFVRRAAAWRGKKHTGKACARARACARMHWEATSLMWTRDNASCC